MKAEPISSEHMMIEKQRESIAFIAGAYLIAYACWGTLALRGVPARASAGATALYMLGGLSATIAALLLPLFAPRDERPAYYRRFFRFRIAGWWYLVPFVPALIMTALSYAIIRLFLAPAAAVAEIEPLYMIVPLFFLMILGGGIEEFGWRGILVHNLRRGNAAIAALAVGTVWACWHIPLFFVPGVLQYHADFIPFAIAILAFSLVTAALYLGSRSVIPCVIAHAWFNACASLGFWYGGDRAAAYVDGLVKLAVGAAFFAVVLGADRARGRPGGGESRRRTA